MSACALVTLAVLVMPSAFADGPRRVVDTFTATTAHMTPSGLNLRIQILEWQEAEARTEVVAALAAGADAEPPLGKLPTIGYVWPSGSPVGYSLKYAHRETQADGSERITLVTDKRLGRFDFKGWSVAGQAVSHDAPYSVIELYLNGSGTGTGTFSLVADVVLDEPGGTVALQNGAGVPSLLANVQRAVTAR